MWTSRIALMALTALVVGALLAGCGGGGGQGLRVPSDPLLVSSTNIPDFSSGEAVDHVIPLQGGCGGPYVMSVIDGRLPDGVYLDEGSHAIQGFALEAGTFDFRVQISDTACEPFQTTTADFHMDVSVGDVTVVQALLDGVPSLIRPGDANYDGNVYGQKGPFPAIPATIYGQFTTITLLVAGGTKPYEAVVYDDPANPYDGPLPTGAVIPENSTSITGSPSEVGEGGGPFLTTVRVTDAVGNETLFTFYWLIRTPPIIVATEEIADGTCGLPYSETFFIVDGVPPFSHELTKAGPGVGNVYDQTAAPDTSGDIVYDPPDPPTLPDPDLMVKIDETYYPAENDTQGGTLDYAAGGFVTPSEGLRLDEASGVLGGVPRRTGTFLIHYHVMSALVPNNYGQSNWRTYSFSCEAAPPIVHDPAYTVEGAFLPDPYSSIAEAEQGKEYNPDGGADGLQLLASGGVPADGWTDAPHVSQAQDISGIGPGLEWPGSYGWAVDYDPDGDGGSDPIPGMELIESQGVWWTPDPNTLVKQLPQEIAFTALDYQLPTSYQTSASETVNFGVGPDTLIISQSSSSCTHNSYYGGFPMNDTNQKIRVIEMGSSGSSSLRDLTADDMAGTGAYLHTVPTTAGASTTLAQLLGQIDILNVSINATGWWDDRYHLNPNGARGFQHGEQNRYYPYLGGPNHVYYYMSSSTSTPAYYMSIPNITSVHLPAAKGVQHEPLEGVHADGGRMYAFDSDKYFGLFVIRSDARIYVPVAFDRSDYENFGDNWTYGWTSNTSAQNYPISKIPQFTMSPDGRIGALKLKRSSTYAQYEPADDTDIVIFSLTGERLWNGQTYKVIGTGASGTTSTGQVLWASSMALTGEYLYYLVGNASGSSWYYGSWRDHFIYRYELFGGASKGSLLDSSDSNWTQASGVPMQTSFQQVDRPFYGSYPDYAMVQVGGYNSHEDTFAPTPFRVSANGKYCAIVAGKNTTSSSGSTVMQHHVWVDSADGLHRLSTTTRRHQRGGSRGYGMREGPSYFSHYQWGTMTGPSTALEISDDGSKVAAVYFDWTSTVYHYSSSYWYQYDEHIVAWTQKNGSDWTSGANEYEVTKPFVSSSICWRFGALVFTKDNNGLVYWGGYSSGYPTSSGSWYYKRCWSFVGSLYGYDFTQSTPGMYSLLAKTDGGRNVTVGTKYTTSSLNSPSTSTWQTDGGVIKPLGGFLSKNREFFYIVNRGSISTSGGPEHVLIGVNVRSVKTSQSINGHTDFRGFALGGMTSSRRRGFQPAYSYYAAYAFGSYSSANYYWYAAYYAPNGTFGMGYQVVDPKNGWVFFSTHYQSSGPYSYASTSYGGPINPTYTYDYGFYSGHVDVFDPNVGGSVQELTPSALGSRTSTSYRAIMYVEVADDGSQLSFVYRYNTYYYFDRDRIGFMGGIKLNPTTGQLQSGSFFANLVASDSRANDSMAHYANGGRVFIAYGSGNENNRQIYVCTPESGKANPVQLPYGPARFNVLHAAR